MVTYETLSNCVGADADVHNAEPNIEVRALMERIMPEMRCYIGVKLVAD